MLSASVSGSSARRVVPAPARAVEEDSAADGLDAVLETEETGAAGEVGSADAVIADQEMQDAVGGFDRRP